MKQRMKCLIAIVNREKGNMVADVCRQYGIHFTYATLALGTAGSEMLNYLGIGETDKELLFSFLPESIEANVMKEIASTIHIKKVGHGIMFSICLSGMSKLFQQKVACGQTYKEDEMEQKDQAYELIVAVVKHGFRDQVMEVAKKAGATGGTVLHARSMQDEDQSKFLGIRLQGEKDVVMILSAMESCSIIMQSINESCGLQSEANGLIFSLPVDHFMGI